MNRRSCAAAIAALLCALMLAVPAARAQKPGFEGDEPCVWSGKYKDWVYQERQLITTYTRPLDLQQAKELVPPPFMLAENPRVRISMLDLYEMAVGPPYKEAEVSLLVTYGGETGWYIVYLPVTDPDACGAGVKNEGFPKVVRKLTIERGERSFAGTLFAPGGELPEFSFHLAYQDAILTDAVRADVSALSQYPSFTFKDGVVFRFPGYPRAAHHLGSAMPNTFEVRFGHPVVVLAGKPTSVLQRLGIEPPKYGFWLKMRARYRLSPERR
jgi:hypothetical protein